LSLTSVDSATVAGIYPLRIRSALIKSQHPGAHTSLTEGSLVEATGVSIVNTMFTSCNIPHEAFKTDNSNFWTKRE